MKTVHLDGSYDNIDLVNLLLQNITREYSVNDDIIRRITIHLNEVLYQLNLKKEQEEEDKKSSEKNKGNGSKKPSYPKNKKSHYNPEDFIW